MTKYRENKQELIMRILLLQASEFYKLIDYMMCANSFEDMRNSTKHLARKVSQFQTLLNAFEDLPACAQDVDDIVVFEEEEY